MVTEIPCAIRVRNPCPDYGCFPPERRFHMDQIPLPFICRMVKRTLGRRCDSAGNYMPAWEKLPTEDSLDKRQATLMPTIRPTGTQPVPCLLILRGTGGQLDWGEIEAYRQAKENGVRVLFQPKAWADTWSQVCDRLASSDVSCWVWTTTVPNVILHSKLRAKPTRFSWCIRLSTTDVTAPVDHHVGAHMKKCKIRGIRNL